MRSIHRILIPALGITMLFLSGASIAETQKPSGAMEMHAPKGEGKVHSHERCELHGGNVSMTKAHHFETVFAPDGIRVYMYSEDQNPLPMDKVSGTVTIKEKNGSAHKVKLVADVLKKGEKAVYFCSMHDSAPQMAPGKCPSCGMNLVLQGGLFGAADLSKAEPGTIKAMVHLTGFEGGEKEVTFTETNIHDE